MALHAHKTWCPGHYGTPGDPNASVCLAGLHTGRVEVTPQGELLIFIQWGDPHGGIGQERYHLTDEDTLVCDVQFTVGDRTAAYQIVHTRRYR